MKNGRSKTRLNVLGRSNNEEQEILYNDEQQTEREWKLDWIKVIEIKEGRISEIERERMNAWLNNEEDELEDMKGRGR